MQAVEARLLRDRRGTHLGQYVMLLALGSAFLMAASGYLSRNLAGSLIDFSGQMLGSPSRKSGSGGSSSSSQSQSTDRERSIGRRQANFSGEANSSWSSVSGFSLAVPRDDVSIVGQAGGVPQVNVGEHNTGGGGYID